MPEFKLYMPHIQGPISLSSILPIILPLIHEPGNHKRLLTPRTSPRCLSTCLDPASKDGPLIFKTRSLPPCFIHVASFLSRRPFRQVDKCELSLGIRGTVLPHVQYIEYSTVVRGTVIAMYCYLPLDCRFNYLIFPLFLTTLSICLRSTSYQSRTVQYLSYSDHQGSISIRYRSCTESI